MRDGFMGRVVALALIGSTPVVVSLLLMLAQSLLYCIRDVLACVRDGSDRID